MKTLQLSEATARKLYPNASPEIKAVFEETFTKEKLQEDITKRVFTVEDACEELGIDYSTLYNNCTDEYEKAEVSIKTFAKAMRQGKSEKECFYYPYFYGSGGGFSYGDYGIGRGFTLVGARLRVFNSEQAKHMGNCLIEEYKIYLGRN